MPRTLLRLAGLLLVAVTPPALSAQEALQFYDRVTLSVALGEEIEADLVTASLFAQAEGPRQSEAAAQVNTAVEWAVARARAGAGIEVRPRRYQTWPVYQKERITGWRVRQSLQLESDDAGRLASLLAELQARLALEQVEYRLSDARRLEAEDRLVGAALAAFQARAARVAESLGRDRWRLVAVEVHTGAAPRPMVMRSAVAAESAPSLEGGTETIRVEARGTVELSAAP